MPPDTAVRSGARSGARAAPLDPSAERRRLTLWLLGGLIVYFGMQATIRTLSGGSYVNDEAEMFLLAQDFRWGYGPQLPGYNWLQAAVFDLFGADAFGLALLKNALLFGCYILLYRGLLRVWSAPCALAGALSLVFLPDFFWEGQRAGTHSVIMCLAAIGFLGAFLRCLQARDLTSYLGLGLWLGIGALSKFNFWFFALPLLLSAVTIPDLRRALNPRLLALSFAIAAAIFLPVGVWMMDNLALATGSSDKFYRHDSPLPAGVETALALLKANAAGLGLLLIVAFLLVGPRRFRAVLFPKDACPTEQLLRRAFGIGAVVACAMLMASGATDIRSRWLLPVLLLIAPAIGRRVMLLLSPSRKRIVGALVAVLAVAGLAGMTDQRFRDSGSGALQIAPLVQALAPLVDANTVIVSDYYLGGNLKQARPDWNILPDDSRLAELTRIDEVILVGLGRNSAAAQAELEKLGLEELRGMTRREEDVLLPYDDPKDRPQRVEITIFD